MPATSLPAPGSVSAYAPQRSGPLSMSLNTPKKRFFCSRVPVARTGGPPRPGPGRLNITAASAHAISSAPIAAVRFVSLGLLGSRSFLGALSPSSRYSMASFERSEDAMRMKLRRKSSGTSPRRSISRLIGRITN
jgi:hypothetical protein